MRYVGRHREPRPLYLRRPVIGGVAAALLVGAPALAISGPPQGLTGARPSAGAKTTAPTSAAAVQPTDGILPQDSAPRTSTSTDAAGERVTVVTSRNSTGQTVIETRKPDGETSTRTTTTKPAQSQGGGGPKPPPASSAAPPPASSSAAPPPASSSAAPPPASSSAAPPPATSSAAPPPATSSAAAAAG